MITITRTREVYDGSGSATTAPYGLGPFDTHTTTCTGTAGSAANFVEAIRREQLEEKLFFQQQQKAYRRKFTIHADWLAYRYRLRLASLENTYPAKPYRRTPISMSGFLARIGRLRKKGKR